MHVISLVARKGGAGKSTLTTNLAVAAHKEGKRVAILDADPQATSEEWGEIREVESPEVIPVRSSNIAKVLDKLRAGGVDLVFIDTPPTETSEARLAARIADLVLIPARPDLWDINAIRATWAMTQEEKVPAFVVLNACPSRAGGMVDDAIQGVQALGMTLYPSNIGSRVAFGRAKNTGQAVVETEVTSKGAQEIRALYEFVVAKLKLKGKRI